MNGAEGIAEDEENRRQNEEPGICLLHDVAECRQVRLGNEPVDEPAADEQLGDQVPGGAQHGAHPVTRFCILRHQLSVRCMRAAAVRRRRTW